MGGLAASDRIEAVDVDDDPRALLTVPSGYYPGAYGGWFYYYHYPDGILYHLSEANATWDVGDYDAEDWYYYCLYLYYYYDFSEVHPTWDVGDYDADYGDFSEANATWDVGDYDA